MKTIEEIRAELEVQYPVLIEVVDGIEMQIEEVKRKAVLDEWAQNMWTQAGIALVKKWVNVQAFVEEFNEAEMSAIELSQNAQIAALRFKLKTWLSEVSASHPLVVAGKNALVSSGILSAQRAETIFSVAN
jgi:hypothetical protein